MKCAVVGDLHVQEARLEEHKKGLAALAASFKCVKKEQGLDVILVTGDLTGWSVPHRATPKERNAVCGFLYRCACLAPTVVVRGNHDYPGDFQSLNLLSAKFPLVYVEQPGFVDVEGKGAIAAMPWLDRADTDRTLPYDQAVTEIYRDAFPLKDLEASKTYTVVGLCHGAIVGGKLDRDNQPQTLTEDPILPVSVFEGMDFVAMGHYHRPHKVAGKPVCVYPGSTFCNVYGELSSKGWVYADVQRGKETKFNLVQVPVEARRMLAVNPMTGNIQAALPIIELPYVGTLKGQGDERTVQQFAEALREVGHPPSHYKLKVKLPAGGSFNGDTAVQQFRELLGDQCLSARCEVERAIDDGIREGADEVAAAQSLGEKVKLVLQTKGIPDEEIDEIVALLGDEKEG